MNILKNKWLLYPIIIGIFGLILRLYVALEVDNAQLYDFEFYYQVAVNIAEGRGHTYNGAAVAWQGCGYPYLLGLFMRVFGVSELNGKILNVILSELTLPAWFFILSKIFDDRKKILLSFTIITLLPTHILYVNVLGTETFFLFILSLIILAELYIDDERFSLPLLGVLIAAAALTKPFMLAYPAVAGVLARFKTGKIIPALRCFGVTFAVMLVCVAPWSYRNYRLFGRLILVSYNAGYCLFINSNDTNVRGSWLDMKTVENEAAQQKINSILSNQNGEIRDVKIAADLEPILKDEAYNWILKNPSEYAKLGFLRLKSTYLMGANDVVQWSLNKKTFENSQKPPNLYYRDWNVVTSFFDFCVTCLNVAGFLFASLKIKTFVVGFFKPSVKCPSKIYIIVLNLLFQSAIVFAFEGQARYAFPTFVFSAAALADVCFTNRSPEANLKAPLRH